MNLERISIAAFWWLAIAFTLAFWIGLWALIAVASAHDALSSRTQPYGWAYDWSCCNTTDCRRLDKDEIEETPTGYIWRSKHSGEVHVFSLGEVAETGHQRIRRSQDEFYHGCETNPLVNPKGQVVTRARKLCLYVPDKMG